ncbi:hypothetical protein ENU1_079010 [Entamoeba nuttalli P19]|uniref:Myosin-light-chain kinase n=1 Tax=Entamoeba nuttalli (strain P19) TaxID=1076696 RepID=K2H019_ENTNP|nr:hypothetical protein ENU1_079010 [Entamoeba nuttalli P19]EKE40798.1 hypothetical protein ENU1_079010 [Entamoeba nuttalli P19]|eukprot:XP_008856867.1 hypothetical protein ENU1_079010 [Entamoeba nuttalli P19]
MKAILFVMIFAVCFAAVKTPTTTPVVQSKKTQTPLKEVKPLNGTKPLNTTQPLTIKKPMNETKPANITTPVLNNEKKELNVTKPEKKKQNKKEVKTNKKQNKKVPTNKHKKLVKKYQKQLALTLQKMSLEDKPSHNRLWKVEKKFFKLHKQAHNVMDKFGDLKHSYDMI